MSSFDRNTTSTHIEDPDNKDLYHTQHVKRPLPEVDHANPSGNKMGEHELETLIHNPRGWTNWYFFFQSEYPGLIRRNAPERLLTLLNIRSVHRIARVDSVRLRVCSSMRMRPGGVLTTPLPALALASRSLELCKPIL